MKRKYWTILANSNDLATVMPRIEERGYTGVQMGQNYAPPFIPLAAGAMVTKRLELASGIAIGLTRSPFETAVSALEVDRISQGRFHLGLGTGPKHFTNGYFGMPYSKPVSRLIETVAVLRHVEDGIRTGDMKPFHGEFHNLEFHAFEPSAPLFRDRLPVWIAALRGRMCEVAGEIADGLVGHPIWSVDWALGEAQRLMAAGAKSAGRDPAAIHFQPYVAVYIDRDAQRAVNLAKSHVAYYGGFEQYHPYFEAHGYAAEARKLQEASKTMNPFEAAALVPDEMARRFAACGTREQVLEWMEPLWQRADSMVIYTPYWGMTPEEFAEKKAEIEAMLLDV